MKSIGKIAAGVLLSGLGLFLLLRKSPGLDLESALRNCASGIARSERSKLRDCISSHELNVMGVPVEKHERARELLMGAFGNWSEFEQIYAKKTAAMGRENIMAFQVWRLTGKNGKSFDTQWQAHNVDGEAACSLRAVLHSALLARREIEGEESARQLERKFNEGIKKLGAFQLMTDARGQEGTPL